MLRAAVVGITCSLLCLACGDAERERLRATTKGTYDPETGRLSEITYDKNQNGRIDTRVRMDGARPLSATIDADEDGRTDRWEYYAADGRIERAGESRARSDRPDLWAYFGRDGALERIEFLEVSDVTGREGVVRRDIYEAGAKVRGEEDTDGDGLVDRWETFAAGRLRTVEFDDPARRDGKPSQRFTYDDDGALIAIETGPDGRGGYRTRRAIR